MKYFHMEKLECCNLQIILVLKKMSIDKASVEVFAPNEVGKATKLICEQANYECQADYDTLYKEAKYLIGYNFNLLDEAKLKDAILTFLKD